MEGRAKSQKGLLIAKKERENSKQLVGRFMRHLRQSGIMRQAKRSIYRTRPVSHGNQIKAALRREELKIEHEQIEKMSKI